MFTLNTRISPLSSTCYIYCSTSRTKICSSSHWQLILFKYY